MASTIINTVSCIFLLLACYFMYKDRKETRLYRQRELDRMKAEDKIRDEEQKFWDEWEERNGEARKLGMWTPGRYSELKDKQKFKPNK